MTVATTASAKTYTGNGASTTWDTDFPVPSADALVVTLTTIATGSEAVLDPSEYSATGFGYTGVVTVTYPTSGSPLASTHKITLERDLAYTQGTDLENQDGFYPNVVENALDYATMLIQQVRNSALRTIQFPVSDGTGLTATLPPASERANKVLIFDTSGNVDVEDFTSGSVGLDTATFDQDATGYFWADAGARIHRMNDRLMLGDATVNDGEAVPTVKDWLETIRDNTTKNSQLAVLSSIGQTAILGGSRSSDFPSAGSMGCIGVQGWAINDIVIRETQRLRLAGTPPPVDSPFLWERLQPRSFQTQHGATHFASPAAFISER